MNCPSTEAAAHQKISRRERDMAIYVEVVCYYHKQSDVARKFGLTQPRVSQIVQRMISKSDSRWAAHRSG